MKKDLSREILDEILIESVLAYTVGGAVGSGVASLVNHISEYRRNLKNIRSKIALCKDDRCKQLLTNKLNMEKKKIMADVKRKLKRGVVGGGIAGGVSAMIRGLMMS